MVVLINFRPFGELPFRGKFETPRRRKRSDLGEKTSPSARRPSKGMLELVEYITWKDYISDVMPLWYF